MIGQAGLDQRVVPAQQAAPGVLDGSGIRQEAPVEAPPNQTRVGSPGGECAETAMAGPRLAEHGPRVRQPRRQCIPRCALGDACQGTHHRDLQGTELVGKCHLVPEQCVGRLGGARRSAPPLMERGQFLVVDVTERTRRRPDKAEVVAAPGRDAPPEPKVQEAEELACPVNPMEFASIAAVAGQGASSVQPNEAKDPAQPEPELDQQPGAARPACAAASPELSMQADALGRVGAEIAPAQQAVGQPLLPELPVCDPRDPRLVHLVTLPFSHG